MTSFNAHSTHIAVGVLSILDFALFISSALIKWLEWNVSNVSGQSTTEMWLLRTEASGPQGTTSTSNASASDWPALQAAAAGLLMGAAFSALAAFLAANHVLRAPQPPRLKALLALLLTALVWGFIGAIIGFRRIDVYKDDAVDAGYDAKWTLGVRCATAGVVSTFVTTLVVVRALVLALRAAQATGDAAKAGGGEMDGVAGVAAEGPTEEGKESQDAAV